MNCTASNVKSGCESVVVHVDAWIGVGVITAIVSIKWHVRCHVVRVCSSHVVINMVIDIIVDGYGVMVMDVVIMENAEADPSL